MQGLFIVRSLQRVDEGAGERRGRGREGSGGKEFGAKEGREEEGRKMALEEDT